MSNGLKTTPLNEWHKGAGANMADFGGYEMPLWYASGVKNEHLAVLKSAGIFDTSHMACIRVEGDISFSLLDFCFTRDLSSLMEGRCVYGAFLNAEGHCIDDAIVYKITNTRFMVCVNAGMGGEIAAHLAEQAKTFDGPVTIIDLSGKVAKMDIQGKNSARILSKLLQSPEVVFRKMPYFSFKGDFDGDAPEPVTLLDDTPVMLSRSGYTGEFGFEIFIAPERIVKLWSDILAAGEEFGISACGLGARDSLRAGACLPLSHQDIGPFKFMNHPWDFALPYTPEKDGFTKTFLGSDALKAEDADVFVLPFVGENLRKVSSGENTKVTQDGSDLTGHVLTCATDMGIGWHDNTIVSINTPDLPKDLKIKGIACGFVMVSEKLAPGTRLTLTEGKRSIKVTVISDIRPDRTARKKIDNFI